MPTVSTVRDTTQPGDVSHRRALLVMGVADSIKEGKNNVKSGFGSLPLTSHSLSPSPSPLFPSLSSRFLPSDLPSDPPSPSPVVSSISSPAASPLTNFWPGPISPKLPPTPASPVPANPPMTVYTPSSNSALESSPALSPSQMLNESSNKKHLIVLIVSVVVGSSLLIIISVMAISLCRSYNVVTVKPWATGLSGQLQKAFVTG